jgi:hypothetical protein
MCLCAFMTIVVSTSCCAVEEMEKQPGGGAVKPN